MIRILYYFNNFNTPMFQWQHVHIIDELSKHGIQIEIISPTDYDSVELANHEILKRVKNSTYDLFMTPFNESHLFVETLDQLRKSGLPSLLICFDNLIIPYKHKNICKYFDLTWLTSIETKYLFDKWGANSIFLPYAANPYISSISNLNEKDRVLFIGTPYGSRAKMINNLISAQIPVTLVSNINKSSVISKDSEIFKKYDNLIEDTINLLRFPIGRKLLLASLKNKFFKQSVLDISNKNLEILPTVDFKTMMELYNNYSISLSSIAARHTGTLKDPVPVINLRSFEIPMAGGLLFSAFTNELADYFEEDKEAVYYRSTKEMIDKARFYLNDNNTILRQKMKQAARKKAVAKHAWFNRFSIIFNKLGITLN